MSGNARLGISLVLLTILVVGLAIRNDHNKTATKISTITDTAPVAPASDTTAEEATNPGSVTLEGKVTVAFPNQ